MQIKYIYSKIKFSGADGIGIEIHNIVDIEKTNNFELVMRLSTNINSSDEFFTDVNGYQVLIILYNSLILHVTSLFLDCKEAAF